MDKHYLTPLFEPRSIVVFAGSPQAAERQTPPARLLHQALQSQPFTGTLRFLDIHTSGTLGELAQSRSDLAIIALPYPDIAPAIELAGRMACRSALVVSSGIEGAQAEELGRVARGAGVHLLGPNATGLQRPTLQLNASIAGPLAAPGPLALVSQSGALTAAMLDWASNNAVGFSSVVSLGPHTALDIADVLDFLAYDPQTRSIVVYVEGITNARRFMSALRTAAHAKPVVMLKAGRKPAGNEAAQTHSAAVVGSDEVFDAALRRAGAVRVRSFVELFSAAKCLASRYRPTGRRLAVITNGGGPGVLAADWINEISLELGKLSSAAAAALKPQLPELASLSDLVDLSEEAAAEHFQAAIAAAAQDAGIDGVLTIFSPKPNVDAGEVAQAVAQAGRTVGKPLLSCWMGDSSVAAGRSVLRAAAIPTFRTPEAAVGAFGNIASFAENQLLLQQTPPPLTDLAKPDLQAARLIIESVLAERRKVLTEMESKTLLSCFHIPVTETILARHANEAMMIAMQLGFPVAMKIDSSDISHKSDAQGVALNITSGAAARDAYQDIIARVSSQRPDAQLNGVTVQKMARPRRGREVYVGLVTDEPFGPVIVFGGGGTMIELINDRAMELPPLNQFLAQRMISRSRVAETLGEWRGAPAVKLEALEHILLRVSEMVCELPQLREMDINPIIVDDEGAVAVDARIVIDSAQHLVHGPSGRPHQYHHLAILPYPSRYEQLWPLPGGGEYTVRAVDTDDARMLQELVQALSPESRYFRFASALTELPASMLARFTLIDYDREMALVAVLRDRQNTERIIGVSRYIINPDQTSCEFSLLVADDQAGKGVGSRLMESLMQIARENGLVQMMGLVLAKNANMLKLMKGLGFAAKPFADDDDFKLVTRSL